MAKPGSSRRALLWTAYAAACAALALAVCELGARVHLFGPRAAIPGALASYHGFHDPRLVRVAPGGLRYELLPRLDTLFKGAPFRTNADGLRDDEHAAAKEPGVKRVAVLGDSMTMPSGVALEDAWFKAAERALAASGARVEFINFAVSGYGPDDYAAVARGKAAAYGPDMLLVGWCAANDHDAGDPDDGPPSPPAQGPRRWYAAELLSRGMRRARATERGPLSARDRAYVRRSLAELKTVAAGRPVLVVYLDLERGYAAELEALVRAEGLHFADASLGLTPCELRRSVLAFPLDGHPNARGHRRLAEALLASPAFRARFGDLTGN